MDSDIFEVIELSRPITMDPAMLGASFFFWNRMTNNFHLRCGMMSPILFELVAITSLRPDGKVLHHCSLPQNILDVMKGASNSFSSFVMYHNKKEDNVIDEELVAFLHL